MIDDYFKVNLLLTSCVHTTGKQVELTLGQLGRERVWALSAKQANLIRDRSISSSANILLFNYQTFALFFVKVMNITVSRKADFSESWILRNKTKIRGWKWSFRKILFSVHRRPFDVALFYVIMTWATASVTRLMDCLFNFWPFTAMNMLQKNI